MDQAERTKGRILEASRKLFVQKGYEETSTGEILKAVGIARGTLYYHFGSKEEILDALVTWEARRALAEIEKIVKEKKLTVAEKLVACLGVLRLEDMVDDEAMKDSLHSPGNALMHQKLQVMLIRTLAPRLGVILQEGVEQGVFDTAYPLEAMELILIYFSQAFDDLMGWDEEELNRKMVAAIYHVERLLGAEAGSFDFLVSAIGGGHK